MTDNTRAALVKLGDTDLTVADADEDIRGREVVDPTGEKIGKVDGLMIDDRESKVRFMLVESGGFLGIGADQSLIPIDAITNIDEDTVRVDQTRDKIAGGPTYDPALTEIPDDYWAGAYGYYGYTPFWGPGYAYPMYPAYGRGRGVR